MKKFDKGYIYYHLLVDFFVILFFTFMFVTSFIPEENVEEFVFTNEFIFTCAGLFVLAYILKTIYSILYVKLSSYELTDLAVKVRKGVFFRKISVLDYVKMHAINKRQNIFHKIFKIAVLTVDSGSTNTSSTAEIIIIEKEKTIDQLIKTLKLKQQGKDANYNETIVDKRENLYTFTSKKMVMYSFLNLLSSVFIIFVLAFIVAITFSTLKAIINFNMQTSFKVVALYFLLVFAVIIAGVSLISFVVSFIASFFTYYNFKVYKNEDDLEISYGMLVKHTNTFKLSKIKGIKIKQGIIKRLFGYATINLEVIGYNNQAENKGNQSEEIGVLMPFCKTSEIESSLLKILPEYTLDKKDKKSVKYSPFVLFTTGVISFITFICTLIIFIDLLLFNVNFGAVIKVLSVIIFTYLLILLLVYAINYLAYKNSGLTINEDKLTIYNGAIVKRITVIKGKNVIAIEKITTPLREKKGIYTYKIHFKTNSDTNEVKVRILSKEVENDLLKILKY